MTEPFSVSARDQAHPQTPTAADKNPSDRPGVPQETLPEPLPNAHWLVPEQQISAGTPLVGHGRHVTSVYSNATPPRAISGLIRRWAYRVPDYRPRRWLMLMLADRIDVLESNPAQLLRAVGSVGLLGLGVYGFVKLGGRRR